MLSFHHGVLLIESKRLCGCTSDREGIAERRYGIFFLSLRRSGIIESKDNHRKHCKAIGGRLARNCVSRIQPEKYRRSKHYQRS